MKNFILGSIIYSMIANVVMLFPSVMANIYFHAPIIFTALTAIYILPTEIVGAIAIDKMKTATAAKQLKKFAIITLILNNPIAGIAMLKIKNKQLNNN